MCSPSGQDYSAESLPREPRLKVDFHQSGFLISSSLNPVIYRLIPRVSTEAADFIIRAVPVPVTIAFLVHTPQRRLNVYN